jgi:hypothetical protein
VDGRVVSSELVRTAKRYEQYLILQQSGCVTLGDQWSGGLAVWWGCGWGGAT